MFPAPLQSCQKSIVKQCNYFESKAAEMFAMFEFLRNNVIPATF
jgi:hypothetical protein